MFLAYMSAYFSCKLSSVDQKLFTIMMIILVSMSVLMVAVNGSTESFEYFGFVAITPFLYWFINIAIVSRNLSKGVEWPSLFEILWMTVTFLAQLGVGLMAF